ncbi:unnamed protein product, partial [Prorocentrum cordatum]
GTVDLTQVLAVDNLLGTSARNAQHDLEVSDKEQPRQPRHTAAKKIRSALAAVFQGAVDKAKSALQDHGRHRARLEGSRTPPPTPYQEAQTLRARDPRARPAAPPLLARPRLLLQRLLQMLLPIATSATSSRPTSRSPAPGVVVHAGLHATSGGPQQLAERSDEAALFYANIRERGPRAECWVATEGKKHQLLALVETHIGTANASHTFLKIGKDDWKPSKCDALPKHRYTESVHEAGPCCGFAQMAWHRKTGNIVAITYYAEPRDSIAGPVL